MLRKFILYKVFCWCIKVKTPYPKILKEFSFPCARFYTWLKEIYFLFCFRCEEKTHRIEPSSLGTVFMCTFGGTRHSPGSCGRTYLSQRDLQVWPTYFQVAGPFMSCLLILKDDFIYFIIFVFIFECDQKI